jgi:hypothetical protein
MKNQPQDDWCHNYGYIDHWAQDCPHPKGYVIGSIHDWGTKKECLSF